eukprot:8328125-Alexandrium_andersonii.AAC.1
MWTPWLASQPLGVARSPVFRIVGQLGAIERMTEVEAPMEEYYESLRADMAERHPKACPQVLGHLRSLEAFLGVSILSGFSFGVEKAH